MYVYIYIKNECVHIFSLLSDCCMSCPAFDSGKKSAFTWKWKGTFKHVEFMALGPVYPTVPVSTLNLPIKVIAQEQRARCQGCLHCLWHLRVSYPRRAWNYSENKLKGAGGAAGNSPWTGVSQTYRAFSLYQVDINRANKIIILHMLHSLWQTPTTAFGSLHQVEPLEASAFL